MDGNKPTVQGAIPVHSSRPSGRSKRNPFRNRMMIVKVRKVRIKSVSRVPEFREPCMTLMANWGQLFR